MSIRPGGTPEVIVLHEGRATKSPPDRFFLQPNMWKERHFVLLIISEFVYNLVYYATDETRKRKGVIPIREIKEVIKGSNCNVGDISSIMMIHTCNPENVLVIRTKHRKYYLMNKDKEEIEAWYQHLTTVLQWQQHQQGPHPEVPLPTPVPETSSYEPRVPPAQPNPHDLWPSSQKQGMQWYLDLKQGRPITYPNVLPPKNKKGTEFNRSYTNPEEFQRPVHEQLINPMLHFQITKEEASSVALDSESDTRESDPQENSEPDSEEELSRENGQPRRVASVHTFQKKKVIVPTKDLKSLKIGKCLYVTNWNPPNDTGCHFNKGDLIYAIDGYRLNSRQMLLDMLKCCTEEEVTLTVLRSRVAPHFHTMGCSCTSPGTNAEAFH